VRRGNNAKQTGIAAVSARLQDGRLRIVQGTCPNLLAEAGLYRFGDGEMPENEHNHALDALRYLVSRLDARRMARPASELVAPEPTPETPTRRKQSLWELEGDERFWQPLR
jgi:hypothetical protein